jgi:hypothetical protein
LNSNGNLRLKQPNGEVMEISSGDVFHS